MQGQKRELDGDEGKKRREPALLNLYYYQWSKSTWPFNALSWDFDMCHSLAWHSKLCIPPQTCDYHVLTFDKLSRYPKDPHI